MSKSREVYSESFASRVAGIYNATKAVGSLAAKTFAPQLTQLAGEYSQNIKRVYRAFNEPKSALKDLFESNPDIFRDCKLVKLIKDSAAGVITEAAPPYTPLPDPGVEEGRRTPPPPARPRAIPLRVEPEDDTEVTASSKNNRYKGSYKAIFEGYVKGNAANSPLQYSKNFSVTIKPNNARTDGDLKYVADRVIFKDDVEFAQADNIEDVNEIAYKRLFNLAVLKNKFTLKNNPNFDRIGYVKRNDTSKGFKLNFDGEVTFPSKSPRPITADEYIIVKRRDGQLQSDGKLYRGTTEINDSVNINYSQKNILIESEKLVDLFCK